MVEGMLAEPRLLRGHQEARLREFLALLRAEQPIVACTADWGRWVSLN